jgi:hypothetical protein
MEELMKLSIKLRYISVVAGLVAGTTVGAMSAMVTSARAAESPAAAINEETSAALARASKTLTATQFSFRSRTMRAYAGPNGELLHIVHATKAVVRRPDRLVADVTGDDGSSKMIYDGKTLVVYGVDQKKYASIPVPGKLDEMLDVASDRMGTDFPLADLLTDNPERSVLSGIISGGQVGVATIDGVVCRHFFFNQSPDLELELWLEDNDRSLPRRVVVTYRSLPGHPTFVAELSDWDFSVRPADAEFVFQPPAGAVQVELPAPAK